MSPARKRMTAAEAADFVLDVYYLGRYAMCSLGDLNYMQRCRRLLERQGVDLLNRDALTAIATPNYAQEAGR